MNLHNNLLVVLLAASVSSHAFESATSAFKSSLKATETVGQSVAEKQTQFVEKELHETIAHLERIQSELEKVASDKIIIKNKLNQARSESARATLTQRLSERNQEYQVLTDSEQIYQAIRSELEQRLKKINDYYADPEFSHVRVQGKQSPNFDVFQNIARQLTDVRQQLVDLEKRKTIVVDDIAKRKKTLESLVAETQEVVDQRDRSKNVESYEAELRYLQLRKELAEGKIKEAELRLDLVDQDYQASRKKASVLKEEYARVKRTMTVDAAYVKKVEQALEKKRQASVDRQDQLHEKIKLLSGIKDETRQKIQDYRLKSALSYNDRVSIKNWSWTPKTISDWVTLSQIGALDMRDALLDIEREYLELQIEAEKVRLHEEELDVKIVRSWHKMTQRTFRSGSDQAIEQDIKAYTTPKNELQADLARLTDRRSATINLLHELNTLLDKIKALSSELKKQRTLLFSDAQDEYDSVLRQLYQSEGLVRERIDVVAKLIEVYSTAIASLTKSIKKVEDVVAELSSKGWWQQQAVHAIEWDEIRNFIPDLKQFFVDLAADVSEHMSRDYGMHILSSLKLMITQPQELFHFILQLIICVILYFILKLYVPDFRRHLLMISPEYGAFARGSYLIASLLGFISEWLFGLYIWGVIFAAVRLEVIQDHFIATLFYSLSIPYLLYILREFIVYFIQANKQRGYAFISQRYQKRFVAVMTVLCAATIVIFFLREAFVLGNNHTSQVPVILLALNFIVLQISLLCLISKEQIVSLIPTRTPLWEWVAEHVDRYYYLTLVGLIAIIVMSNPYVGYGRQVIYVLSRLLFTVLLIPLFSWLHNRLKRLSSDLFFYYTDSEAIKERFTAAKTWYGFFVVISFVLFIIIGIVIGAMIWGKSIGLREISQWLSYELYSPGIDELTGKRIAITALSIFQIFGFIVGGVIVTYIINYFLLRRIFDPLLVGAGVQNTILTLTKYVILIIAILIGLQSAGLEGMATKLAVIFGVIGFAAKEPIGDFFSYFIILVQRPIGIGDLVMVENNDIMGVVRQITPRSTILRRRNSVTVIVPNSHIITKPVVNWNYTRTFFAFEDMLITVPYSADPHNVRAMIFKVLDENSNILKNPAPIVWLHDFVDNGFQFLVRGYLTADKTLNQWEIASEVRLEIVRRLRQESIDIASPTRLVKITDSGTEKAF